MDAWWKRAGPWVGIGTSPAALMTGGGLAKGLEGGRLVATLLVGVAALCVLATVQGVVGQRHGGALVGVLEAPLGTSGARRVAGAVMALMMLGWFGVNVDAAGTAAARLAGVAPAVGIVAFAVVALAVTLRGVGHLSAAALVAGVATSALAAWSLGLLAQHGDVGVRSAHTAAEPVSMLHGVGLMVGYGAAFALRTPDFTADLVRARDVVLCAVCGLAIPLAAFAALGAATYAWTGAWNIADMWGRLGSDRLGYAIIAVGFFGSVMTNLFSGALATGSAAGLGPAAAMGAFFALGLGLAVGGLADHMLGYLVLMAVTAPGLVLLCVWGRGRPVRPWNPVGLAAWGASMAVGLALAAVAPGWALPASLATAALVVVVARCTYLR